MWKAAEKQSFLSLYLSAVSQARFTPLAQQNPNRGLRLVWNAWGGEPQVPGVGVLPHPTPPAFLRLTHWDNSLHGSQPCPHRGSPSSAGHCRSVRSVTRRVAGALAPQPGSPRPRGHQDLFYHDVICEPAAATQMSGVQTLKPAERGARSGSSAASRAAKLRVLFELAPLHQSSGDPPPGG